MDLDALTAARRDEWARLDELSRARHLTGREVDELVTRYRAASADLADVKTSAGRTPHGDHVSTILARARLRLTGAPENVLRQIPRFFALQLPAALYRLRWLTLVIAVGFVAVATARRALDLARPGAHRESRQPAAARAVRRERVHRLLQREPRRRVRRHGLDEQRLDRCAVRAVRDHGLLADHGARAERGGRGHRRRRDGGVRPRRRLPAVHPAARPSRADVHLRRGRRGTSDLLVVGRARPSAPRRVAGGGRALPRDGRDRPRPRARRRRHSSRGS